MSTKTTKGDRAFIDERGPGGWRAVEARWDRLGRLRRRDARGRREDREAREELGADRD